MNALETTAAWLVLVCASVALVWSAVVILYSIIGDEKQDC